MKTYFRFLFLLAGCLCLLGCGFLKKPVRVGSKGTGEQLVIGEITAQLLEKSNFKVERRLGLGDSTILHAAVSGREIDVYPEDTVSAITITMKETPIMDAPSMWSRVRSEYQRQYGLRFLEPLGGTNETVLVVMKTLAATEGIATASAAAASKVRWQIGITPEFSARGDGLTQLTASYRFQQRFGAVTLAATDLYRALRDGQVNIITATATDGLLADPSFQTLEDDRHLFPPSQLCLIARDGAFGENPGLDTALARLTGKIATKDLSGMAREVEVSKRNVADVARDFLARAGL